MSSRPGPDRARLRAALQAIVGPDGVLTEPDELLVYESDGLTIFRATADAVVFPRTTAEVAACVRLANAEGLPFVARGAGTGLAGGCLPSEGGIVIALTRMARILEVDYANQLAVVEPGLVNLHLSQALGPRGLLLRAGPLEPARLHDRRQRRQQLGRPAHAEVRRHDEPRARGRGGAARRRGGLARGQGPRPAGLRPRRPLRGLGGDVRHRDEGRRADRAPAPGGAHAPRGVRPARPGVADGGGDHRARAHAGGDRDDRPAHDPGRRGRLRRGLPARRGGGAAHRAGRARGRPRRGGRPRGRRLPRERGAGRAARPGRSRAPAPAGRGGSSPSAPTGASRPRTW